MGEGASVGREGVGGAVGCLWRTAHPAAAPTAAAAATAEFAGSRRARRRREGLDPEPAAAAAATAAAAAQLPRAQDDNGADELAPEEAVLGVELVGHDRAGREDDPPPVEPLLEGARVDALPRAPPARPLLPLGDAHDGLGVVAFDAVEDLADLVELVQHEAHALGPGLREGVDRRRTTLENERSRSSIQ
jgi:hypothetical protein